jgi:hypothetical protein
MRMLLSCDVLRGLLCDGSERHPSVRVFMYVACCAGGVAHKGNRTEDDTSKTRHS